MSSVLQLSLQCCLLSSSGTLWEPNCNSSANRPWKHSYVEGWRCNCFTFWVEETRNLLFAGPTKSVHCILTFSSFLWFFSFCRLPNRPIINTPVVSTAIHSDRELPPNLVEKPIIVEYAMLETEERTKPVCVFWNHSITYVSAFSKAVQSNCLSSREVLARRIILEENLFHVVYSTGNYFLVEWSQVLPSHQPEKNKNNHRNSSNKWLAMWFLTDVVPSCLSRVCFHPAIINLTIFMCLLTLFAHRCIPSFSVV